MVADLLSFYVGRKHTRRYFGTRCAEWRQKRRSIAKATSSSRRSRRTQTPVCIVIFAISMLKIAHVRGRRHLMYSRHARYTTYEIYGIFKTVLPPQLLPSAWASSLKIIHEQFSSFYNYSLVFCFFFEDFTYSVSGTGIIGAGRRPLWSMKWLSSGSSWTGVSYTRVSTMDPLLDPKETLKIYLVI